MDWIDALILGIVQGLSEYLPISSSGHLEILKQMLGLNLDPDSSLEFSVMLHVATVLSTIVVLWREFLPLCISFFTFKRDGNFYYVLKILLSCVPVGIVGLFFKDQVAELFEGDLTVVGVCLIVTALLLTLAWMSNPPAGKKPMVNLPPRRNPDITWMDAIVIGIAQAIAVLPGLSRSGTTIATGLILGNKRTEVAKFSFFMVIIPILGEGLLSIKELLEAAGTQASAPVSFTSIAIGFIAAFAVGCVACKWMINLVNQGKLVWFALYCVIMGIVCLVF